MDFTFPLEGMANAITSNTRIVYVNNPSNASGRPIRKEAIRTIARAAGQALVFVDEAYHDFLGENFLDEAEEYPHVLVVRTYCKAFGLPGMRFGLMTASPQIFASHRSCMRVFPRN